MIDKPALIDPAKSNRAYLLGISRSRAVLHETEDHLAELAELVGTMGMEVAGTEICVIAGLQPAYLIGAGKADMVRNACLACEAGVLIVDDDLSPAQQRNWEKLGDLAVIDRREVILEIFRQRARTHEARLQVELAKLEYSLPRLKRAWTHLERQRGGGGFTGGAGELQIEVDRRLIRDRIARLKRDIVSVRHQRATQRKGRHRRPVPTAAIVGYTNSGKSTLLNRLTGAGVLAEDKLFATLDPTTRRVELANNQALLLTDTVGFIRKLPHMLVDAFKATLEETQAADFLVHVVDASHPAAMEHITVTEQVLEELGVANRPTLVVLNKVDRPIEPLALAALRERTPHHVLTSLTQGIGLEELMAKLAEFSGRDLAPIHLHLPHDRQDLLAFLHREGHILAEKYTEEGIEVEARLAPKFQWRVEQFFTAGEDD